MFIQVIGHRGARGLLPELSLAGFSKALDLNVDMIELDIGVTRDDTVVVYHDRTLNSDITRDSEGNWIEDDSLRLCDLNYEELRHFDIGMIKPGTDYHKEFPHQKSGNGHRIPRLEDVVSLVRSRTHPVTLCIEAKFLPSEPLSTHELEIFSEIVANEIKRLDIADTSVIHSFDWQMTRAIQEQVPNLSAWHLTSQLPSFNTLDEKLAGICTFGMKLSEYSGSVPQMIVAAGGDVWNGNYQALNAGSIKQAHDLGLKVYAWTVNSEEEFQRLCDAGVDGIVTDYPDRLINFLERQA